MKKTVLILIFWFIKYAVIAQNINIPTESLSDTAFHYEVLTFDTSNVKLVKYQLRNITLYFPYDEFLNKWYPDIKPNSQYKKNNTYISGDSLFMLAFSQNNNNLTKYKGLHKENNIFVPDDSLVNTFKFPFVVQSLLKEGKVAVFDYYKNTFNKNISYRIERYGTDAYRVFYLPDNRIIFMIEIISGIYDDDTHGVSNPADLGRLFDKLNSVGK